jgi:hypothetical protein
MKTNMRKRIALLLVAGFLISMAVVAQENPGNNKPVTEQQNKDQKKATKAKSKEEKAEYKKFKKEQRKKRDEERVPSVIRDRNIP